MNVNGQDVTIELSASAEKAGKAIEKTAELLKRFSVAAKTATSQTYNFTKAVSSAGLKTALSPLKKYAGNVSDFTKKIGQLGAAFKRIVFYRAIRTIIKEIGDAFRVGTQNLYYYSQGIGGEFARSMDMAATSMLYFKNSIGAAVAPIVNALAPVLDMLVDKIVAVINAINQLFAKLTGATSWTRAIKHPVAYGEAVKGAGKAAKEALRYLAPFDELNVLPSDKGSGGGGSSAAEDYSSMFEEMTTFNSAIADFAEKLKKAIQSGDWTGAGKLLGGKVNDLLNYIDDNNLASKFGHKVGYWINGGIQTAYSFLSTVDFRKVGKIFADGLNGALEEIDFTVAGRLFVKKFTALFDIIIGFMGELDWKLVGKSIGNYLRGAFNEASDWAETVNWKAFGKSLWTNAMDFIEGIDFGSLANSFFNFLGHAFGAAVGAIGGFFTGVWEDVREYFRKKTEEAGGDTWEGFKKGVKDAWNNVTEWVKTNIVDPFINGVKSVLGIHSPSTVMAEIGDNVIEGFKVGLSRTWKNITTWFSDRWNALKSWWSKLELPAFKIKKPHLSWTSTPATGWIANVLKTLGLPTSLPKLNVQWYAKGGIIDKASLIGAGEAGKEAIIPLERNTEWISRVAHEMREQASRQNANPFGGDIACDLEDANGVVVDAIYAAAAQILQGMRENKSGGLDYRAITKEVTRLQKRQAMATGV
ncbi:MAG: hypothetical protein II630_01660 [Bacteroidales bacterium]|nr:hypothetical protein [Bacteroidales bacterium]